MKMETRTGALNILSELTSFWKAHLARIRVPGRAQNSSFHLS